MGKRVIMGGTDFNTSLIPPKGWRAKLTFWLKGGYVNIAAYQAGFNSRAEYSAWLKENEGVDLFDGNGGEGGGRVGSGDAVGPGDGGSDVGGPGGGQGGGTGGGHGQGRGGGVGGGRGSGKGGGHGKGHGQGVGGGKNHK